MEATLPLSPRTCLLISVHHPAGEEVISPDQVADVKLRSAAYSRKLVYSSRPVDPRTLNNRLAGQGGDQPPTSLT
jgi:hypothetical protein